MDAPFFVYILASQRNGTLYVGVTNNLENRIAEHSDGRGGAFTRKHRLNTLVYVEEYQYVDEAIAREKEVKGWRRSKKDALIETQNPTWTDLLDPGNAKGPSLCSE